MNESSPHHHIKIIIIATQTGIPLVTLKIDKTLNEQLIAPYFSALHGFSDEKLGGLNETLVKSGNLDMYVQRDHGLILIVIMDQHMTKVEIGKEADEALEFFYEMYKEEIDNFDITQGDLEIFKKFELLLKRQMKKYYNKITETEDGTIFSKLKKFFGKDKSKPEIR